LSLKTKVDGLSVVWPQNHWDGFHQFGKKNRWRRFLRFGLNTDGESFLVELQNQGGGGFPSLDLKISGYGLSVASQNRREGIDAGHTSRYSGLFRVEASLTRVFKSGLKTGGGAMAGGACATIAEVASESSQRWTSRCDGLRQTLLPLLCHFCSIRS
jgi:hypothetical protein